MGQLRRRLSSSASLLVAAAAPAAGGVVGSGACVLPGMHAKYVLAAESLEGASEWREALEAHAAFAATEHGRAIYAGALSRREDVRLRRVHSSKHGRRSRVASAKEEGEQGGRDQGPVAHLGGEEARAAWVVRQSSHLQPRASAGEGGGDGDGGDGAGRRLERCEAFFFGVGLPATLCHTCASGISSSISSSSSSSSGGGGGLRRRRRWCRRLQACAVVPRTTTQRRRWRRRPVAVMLVAAAAVASCYAQPPSATRATRRPRARRRYSAAGATGRCAAPP